MAHQAQQDFFGLICLAKLEPHMKRVLDVGSMDVNGNNRAFFPGREYTGLDIAPGRNVDIVCDIMDHQPNEKYDIVVSSEMLEHDRHWRESIEKMVSLVRTGGLMILSCAGPWRPIHGTRIHKPEDCPGMATDHYENLTILDIAECVGIHWKECGFEYDGVACDTRFWGIKR